MKKLTPQQYAELLYELVSDAKKAEVSGRVASFAGFLVRTRATAQLPRIEQAFDALFAQREGMMRVEVLVAQKASSTLRAELMKALRAKKLEIVEIVDPTLIGGMRVKIHDTIVDGTIKTQLARLQSALSN